MTSSRNNRLRDNGPAPESAVSLYPGSVMHHRMKPKVHRFNYRVFSMLLDLDRLEEASRRSWLFSVDKFNLLSFHRKDHGPRDGSCLRRHVENLLADQGIAAPKRILLLAYPRLFGYGFNPLSVYYAYDEDETLTGVVYEVRNTFGGLHTYALPVETGQMSDAGVRQTQRKEFYVSPFLSMQQSYFFRMLPPGESVRVRILEKDTKGPILSATFSGERKKFTTGSILGECLRVPFLTFKIMAAIHWEAFKIWRKRVPFHSRPAQDALEGGPDRHNRHASLASNE
ncbi:DUF1365 domain-containing protein [uncultured Roseibium sp.]|uniref:DUF1365 domain-containing protein n=1 Tax=uncultured Roseibium sp. TaxID=1936171 RepID=UPI00262DFD99|nr:DUF1365 domain-containing protein [uncultured Roseibium sp.]